MRRQYLFDCEGLLLEEIHERPDLLVPIEVEEFKTNPKSRPFNIAAERLFPVDDDTENITQRKLFFAGCAITYTAFGLSSLESTVIEKASDLMLLRDVYDARIQHAAANEFELIEELSVQGVRSHGGELGPIDIALSEYYQNLKCVENELDLHFISMAMGFAAFRFDTWVQLAK